MSEAPPETGILVEPDAVAAPGGDGPPQDDPTDHPEPVQPPARSRRAVEIVLIVVVALAVAVGMRLFVFQTYSIPSGSMEPTLGIGDRIVVDKLAYHLHAVHRDDIVVFATPSTEAVNCGGAAVPDLVKRVIGLPGETLSLRRGHVYVDGHELNQSFLPPATRSSTGPGPGAQAFSLHNPYRVPAGEYFVMGDNRTQSCDSRWWGPIPASSIVGKVDAVVWPLSQFHIF